MYVQCDSCGVMKGEHVNECTVCNLKEENVMLKLEIKMMSESMNEENEMYKLEMKMMSESINELEKQLFEMRKEESVRPKISRDVQARREGATGVLGSSDSPRQENDRRGDEEVVDRAASSWKVIGNGDTCIRISKVSNPVNCSNRFDCLPDEGGSEIANDDVQFSKSKTETLLVGDSMIRNLDRTFQKKDRRKRMRVCFPGARVNDIADRIDREIMVTSADSTVIVHVGTNDIGQKRSEELIASYRRLIAKMKESGRKCMISGILPRFGAGQEWESRALGINERVRKLCSSYSVRFLDLWGDFQDRKFFVGDGLHLSFKGVERFSNILENSLSKN